MVTWKIPADQLLSLPGPKQLSRRQNRRQSYGSSPRISHSTSPDCTLQLKELELLPGLTEHDFPHFTRFSLASTTHVLQFSYAPGNVLLQCIPELEPFLDHLQTRHGWRKVCRMESSHQLLKLKGFSPFTGTVWSLLMRGQLQSLLSDSDRI